MPEEDKKTKHMKKIAVILIRGLVGANKNIIYTLKLMNICKRNQCFIADASPHILGMVSKIKDYTTYGEIDDATFKILKERKGEGSTYSLNSPRKGYGRKGIKLTFAHGGALGYRGDKINDLIKRML